MSGVQLQDASHQAEARPCPSPWLTGGDLSVQPSPEGGPALGFLLPCVCAGGSALSGRLRLRLASEQAGLNRLDRSWWGTQFHSICISSL